MNKYTYICDKCDRECGVTEQMDEIPYAPDHENGGAKWTRVEVQVSDCCGANFEIQRDEK